MCPRCKHRICQSCIDVYKEPETFITCCKCYSRNTAENWFRSLSDYTSRVLKSLSRLRKFSRAAA